MSNKDHGMDFRKVIRKNISPVLGWIHLTLLYAPLVTALFTIGLPKGTVSPYLYLYSLLIVVAVALADIMERKCRFLFLYIVTGVVSVIGIAVFSYRLVGTILTPQYQILFTSIIVVECLIIWVIDLHNRLENKHVPSTPQIGFASVFVIYYLVGLGFSGKVICDIAFYSMILYCLISMLQQFLSGTEKYISLNHSLKNIPLRRIYGIGGGTLALISIGLFLAIIPSIVLGQARSYTDLREMKQPDRPEEIYWEQGESMQMTLPQEDVYLQELLEEGMETPKWVENLFQIVYISTLCLIIFLLIKGIFHIFSEFKKNFDENGDKIEEIDEERERLYHKRFGRMEDSEEQKIRREYRRMIRRHRKDRPHDFESPTEIEAAAGLLADAKMKALHKKYEAVRYGDDHGEKN